MKLEYNDTIAVDVVRTFDKIGALLKNRTEDNIFYLYNGKYYTIDNIYMDELEFIYPKKTLFLNEDITVQLLAINGVELYRFFNEFKSVINKVIIDNNILRIETTIPNVYFESGSIKRISEIKNRIKRIESYTFKESKEIINAQEISKFDYAKTLDYEIKLRLTKKVFIKIDAKTESKFEYSKKKTMSLVNIKQDSKKLFTSNTYFRIINF